MKQTKVTAPERRIEISNSIDFYTGRKEFVQNFFSLKSSQFNQLTYQQKQLLFELIDNIDVAIEFDRTELIESQEVKDAKTVLMNDSVIHRYYQEVPISNFTKSIREIFDNEDSSMYNSILRQMDISQDSRVSNNGKSSSERKQTSNQPSSNVSRFVFLKSKSSPDFDKLSFYERGRILNYLTVWNDWSFLPISRVTILDFTARFYEFMHHGQLQFQSQENEN